MCKAKFLNPFKMSPGMMLAKKIDPVTKALVKNSPGAKALAGLGVDKKPNQNAVLGQGQQQAQSPSYLGGPYRQPMQ